LGWLLSASRSFAADPDWVAALEAFHAPLAGFSVSWQFMRLLRRGMAGVLLADVPRFLSCLNMPALVIHGRREPAITESFARRVRSEGAEIRAKLGNYSVGFDLRGACRGMAAADEPGFGREHSSAT